ncbi:hypothetical protein [Krasilnikoviella flava]|uniref:hypothetical protein n=1 Tax=Krasilnikoviella flava TaxID=526729 RepID=UPI0015925E23|nr:hypothetical protein [Krasilnikoviella flava]
MLVIAVLFVVAAGASVYVVEWLAPGISDLGRAAVTAPIVIGGGLSVRAAAEPRRRERARDRIS